MGLFDQFPYTNFHELNLDWILRALKELEHTIDQFVAINALKYADPIQWDITSQYEKNTIVIDPQTGTAYISVQPVPTGVSLTNPDYWTVVFDLGSFVVRAAKNFANTYEAATTLTATVSTPAGGWLVWGETLYKANVNITAGDSYVEGSNITHITIEDVIGHLEDLTTTNKSNIVAAINEVADNIGTLTDLNTTDKSNLVAAINEVNTTGGGALAKIGDLNDLQTTDKSNLVAAINEEINNRATADTDIVNIIKSITVTPEMFGAVGDGVTDDTQAINTALANGDVILFQNDYKVTDVLCVEGNKIIKGNGTIHAYNDGANYIHYVFGLGAVTEGVAGEVFTGSIDGLNIICESGKYRYVIGGTNADNCSITNCTFDLSNADCGNKVIFFGDNAALAGYQGTAYSNYNIANNDFIFNADPNNTINQCEPIGAASRNNVEVIGNHTRYAKDDLGFHGCDHVNITNNIMKDNFTARIGIFNCRNVNIVSNVMEEFDNKRTMGIYVSHEDGYLSVPPENINIIGNTIDYRRSAATSNNYGIRLEGVKHVIIANNNLISNDIYTGRIYIQNLNYPDYYPELYWSEDVHVHDNICTAIVHTLNGGSGATAIEPCTFSNNEIRDTFVLYSHYDFSSGNQLQTGTQFIHNYNANKAPWTLCAVLDSAISSTPAELKINGFPKMIFTRTAKIFKPIAINFQPQNTLSGANYYRLKIKKNNVDVATVDVQDNYLSNLSDDIIMDQGDYLTLTLEAVGTVSTPPNYYQVELVLDYYDEC